MNVADELEKLQKLHESGGISDEEFAKAKAKLLTSPTSGLDALFGGSGNAEQQTRQWAMILHLSQLLNFTLVGFILPIVIWQVQKAKLPGIDAHGKVVCNWIISAILYWIVCFLLCFAVIGFPMMMVLFALMVIFPIIGGIKANNGEVWAYPMSIPFIK